MAGGPEDHFTDSRELYVLVEGGEWAHVEALDPDASARVGPVPAAVWPWACSSLRRLGGERRRRRARAGAREGGDVVGDVLGVVLDPAQQR